MLMPSCMSCAVGLKNLCPLMLLPKNTQPPVQPQRDESPLTVDDQRNHRRRVRLSCNFRKL